MFLRKLQILLSITFVWLILSKPTLLSAQNPPQSTYRKVMTLQVDALNVMIVDWDSSGSRIATVEYENGTSEISIWDARNGDLMTQFDALSSGIVMDMEWSPDSRFLAIGFDVYFAEIWEIDGNGEANIYAEITHEGVIRSISWDPTGQYLLTSSGSSSGDLEFDESRTVYIWDIETITEPSIRLPDEAHRVTMAKWSPDGNYLAMATWDNEIQLWDAEALTLLNTIDMSEYGTIQQIDWNHSSEFLAISSCHNIWCNLVVINPIQQTLVDDVSKIHTRLINDIDWHPTLDIIASAGDFDGTVKLTKTNDQDNPILSIDAFDNETILSLSWSPDGMHIVTSDASGSIIVWEIDLSDLAK